MKDEMMQRAEATADELEAFKIAIQMEKEGIEFYKKAAIEAKTEKEKLLFGRLIKEEQQHYNIFANTYFFSLILEAGLCGRSTALLMAATPWA
ncbi:MAG: ferritin family protein [Nitrospirota bacterium]